MNNNGNLVGLGIMAVAAVAVAAGSQPLYNAIQESRLKSAAGGEEIRTLTGQAEGYGGPISVTRNCGRGTELLIWKLQDQMKLRTSAVLLSHRFGQPLWRIRGWMAWMRFPVPPGLPTVSLTPSVQPWAKR